MVQHLGKNIAYLWDSGLLPDRRQKTAIFGFKFPDTSQGPLAASMRDQGEYDFKLFCCRQAGINVIRST